MSLTIKGLIVAFLGMIAQSVGWEGETVSEEQIEALIGAMAVLAQIGGLLVAYFGRLRKGDIDWLGRKIRPNVTIDSIPDVLK